MRSTYPLPARWGVSSCVGGSGRDAAADRPGLQQPVAQRRLLLGGRIPLRDVREVFGGVDPELLAKQIRRAVQDRAELRAARLLDETALDQRGGRGVRGHAADAGYL